ncbi:hypothetical protein RhiirA5_387384, partial [Rhizophagus irregularis]
APMTEACHKLFQTNKNPSDAEIERVFKLQIQTDHPEKMRELSSLNGWSKLWDASYSIVLEYFRNHRSSYVRKIKDTVYTVFNLFTCKPNKFTGPKEVRRWKESETVKNARLNLWNKMDNDPDSLYFIEFILQRSFSKEELQIMDNVKFGITVILMLLDPTYDQPEVSSSKVQERIGKWDSDVVIQRWLKGKSPLEDDNIMDNDMISRNYNNNNSEEQNTTESDLENNLEETNETVLAGKMS